MSNRYARILAAAAAAALLAALGTPAALAAATADTWTVQPGGGIKAAAGSLTLTDTTSSGAHDTCTSATMSGTLKAGSGLPGSGIGSISKASYRGCGILGSRDLAPRGLPWHLNMVSFDAATGVSRGTATHLKIA